MTLAGTAKVKYDRHVSPRSLETVPKAKRVLLTVLTPTMPHSGSVAKAMVV